MSRARCDCYLSYSSGCKCYESGDSAFCLLLPLMSGVRPSKYFKWEPVNLRNIFEESKYLVILYFKQESIHWTFSWLKAGSHPFISARIWYKKKKRKRKEPNIKNTENHTVGTEGQVWCFSFVFHKWERR